MEQLFLTILNRAVTAGWLVLLVMVLRVVLKKAPRAAHYGLWAIVAVRLLWPGDLLPRAGVSLVPTTEPISGDVLTAAGTAVSGGLPAVGSPAGAAAAETAARTGQSLGHIAAVVWLVGMAAMALYLAGSYVRLRVRLRTAVRLEDGVWESEQAPSPFVLGFIRPRIYLPFGLDRGSRDYVLAHERTHIRHRDHWVKPLAFLLLAVYWFNPLLWAAYILLCRDMEYACDEAVLRDLEEPDKRAYSQALLNCAGPRRAVTACPVAFGEICVKGRIRRALRYKKPAVWVTAAAVVVCAAAAVCLLTNPRDRTPYGWASRVTAGGLNVTYLREGNSARTPAGMPGLTSRLAEQLNGLTEEDFPLLENYAYNISDQGREPFCLQMGRTAGKRELLYGGDSGYPLMLLYRGKLYGVNSEELLQTILEYTRGVQVVPAGTELALRMGLPGVYRMMTKESADGPDVIQGDDFSWTPAAWQGGMAYVDLMRTEGDASGSVGRIWCARARWGGQERWLVYARDGQIALRPTESGSTRLSVVGRGLAVPEDGTYLTAECVYQTPELPSPSPLSAELLPPHWTRRSTVSIPSRAVRASAWRSGTAGSRRDLDRTSAGTRSGGCSSWRMAVSCCGWTISCICCNITRLTGKFSRCCGCGRCRWSRSGCWSWIACCSVSAETTAWRRSASPGPWRPLCGSCRITGGWWTAGRIPCGTASPCWSAGITAGMGCRRP